MTRLEAFCASLAEEIERDDGCMREIIERRVRALVVSILGDRDTEGLLSRQLDAEARGPMDHHPFGRG